MALVLYASRESKSGGGFHGFVESDHREVG
jgi:hypothetical protein